jgi:hypothetical protein
LDWLLKLVHTGRLELGAFLGAGSELWQFSVAQAAISARK